MAISFVLALANAAAIANLVVRRPDPQPATPKPSASSSAPQPEAPKPEAPKPAASPSAEPSGAPPAPSVVAPAVTNEEGRIATRDCRAGFRVFVDGVVAGNTPDSFVVRCGKRTVQIGSKGYPQHVDVPCGGEVVVTQK